MTPRSRHVGIKLGLLAAVYLAGVSPVPVLGDPAAIANADGIVDVPVVVADGHDTDPRDRGRPVALVAAGLGVPAEIFRDAFSHVHPATNGKGPTPDAARQNKRALMEALAKYGVTNERLDEVSNAYRYRRDGGELWTHRDAMCVAHVRNGRVVSVTVMDAGAGYTSPPTLAVPGYPDTRLIASLAFGKNLSANGRIDKITTGDGPTTRP